MYAFFTIFSYHKYKSQTVKNLPGVYADRHKLYTQQYVRRHVYMFKAIIPQLHWSFFLHTKVKKLKHTFKGRKKKGTNWVLGIITESFSSVQFSRSVVSDSLWPHGPHHARPRCPSPTPRVYWNSCPLSQWCHPTISSSVVPFSSCLQSFPASGSFQMSQLFTKEQKWPKYWSFSFNISPSNEHLGLISFRMEFSLLNINC